MVIRLLRQLTLLAVVAFLNACSWEGSDDENYVELTRPPESIPLSVDLSGVNPDELVYLPKQVYVHYTLNTQNRSLLEQKFYLDGEEQVINKTGVYQFYVLINRPAIDDKIHELRLSIQVRTNSGSVADISGAELYSSEFIYKTKIIETKDVKFKITQTLDENKHLKLKWEKPKDFEVERYEIYASVPRPLGLMLTIDDPNQTYFVDKDYSSGDQRYEIRAIPKNNIDIPYIMDAYTVKSK